MTASETMYPKRAEPPDRDRKTVEFSSRDVEDAARLLSMIAPAKQPEPIRPDEPQTKQQFSSNQLMEQARRLLRLRRRRQELFGRGIFGEVGWEMLLSLYVHYGGRRHIMSHLVQTIGCPATTGIRWLEYLEGEGLTMRRPHPTDRRSFFVELTETGRTKLEAYLSETLSFQR